MQFKKLKDGYKFAFLIAIVSAVVLPAYIFSFSGTSSDNPVSSGLDYNARVCVYKNGEEIDCHYNLLLNDGKNLTRNMLTGNSAGAGPTIIALGNGTATQAATDKVLATEIGNECGLGRAAGTVNFDTAYNNIGNWSVTKTFTSTCNSAVVNTTALYNSSTLSSPNNTFAETTFTSTTLQANDQLNITWFVWVS